MTADQIVEEIWKLGFWDALSVAMRDDFIVVCKAWPLLLLLFGGLGTLIYFVKRSERYIHDPNKNKKQR